MADALCQPRVAAMTEQVMGSVSITILGDNGFAPFRRQARIAHAQRDSAVASSVSPANRTHNGFPKLERRACRLTAAERAIAQITTST
jgi:hypothetical protein